MAKRVLGLLLLVALAGAQEAPGPGFLRPTNESVLAEGSLVVVAKTEGTGELKLDGKAVEAKQPAPNVLTATVRLVAGRHTLTLSTGGTEHKAEVFVKAKSGGGAAPEGWADFRQHPPAATCETCHAVKDGAWAFKSAVLSETCFGCHDAKAFPSPHSHTAETLAECQLCHAAHGSTVKGHLKYKRETACKLCHA
jgi:predicted CXXCH cytochrome family protein